MQLPGEIFDCRNYPRSGAIHGITDDGKTPVAHGVKTAPTRPFGEDVEIILSGIGMRRGENKKVGLKTDNFLKIHLRPVLCSVHNGAGARALEGIGDKSVLADGDQWI